MLAVLLGTEGMGLFGAYSSVTTLVSGITGMGISNSGVRQIAEASGSNDQKRIERIAVVLRKTSFALGLFGMLRPVWCYTLPHFCKSDVRRHRPFSGLRTTFRDRFVFCNSGRPNSLDPRLTQGAGCGRFECLECGLGNGV